MIANIQIHELKTLPRYFMYAWIGEKPFEIRLNDRRFKVGDRIRLREWSGIEGYSGREIEGVISYVTDFMQKPEHVVFAYELTRRREQGDE